MRAWFFLGFFLATAVLTAGPLSCQIHTNTAILVDAKDGRILFEKNADQKVFPASTTKLATLLYALTKKGDNLDAIITVDKTSTLGISPAEKIRGGYKQPSYYVEFNSNHIGLKPGEQIRFRDLLAAALVASANDASNVIATYVSGSIPAFVAELNEFLKQLGCTGTHYTNPHGLHHPDHYTTARDAVLIGRAASKQPVIAEMAKSRVYNRPKTNMSTAYSERASNRLLVPSDKNYYAFATGLKTGLTKAGGYAVVASAEKNGRQLIAAVLAGESSAERFSDAATLFEAVYSEKKKTQVLLNVGPQTYTRTLSGASQPLTTKTKQELSVDYVASDDVTIDGSLEWLDLPLPLTEGQVVAKARAKVMRGEEVLCESSIDVLAANNVEAAPHQQLLSWITEHLTLTLAGASVLGIGIFWLARRR